MTTQGRTPPCALDAERSVLQAVLLDAAAYDQVADRLGAEDFWSEPNAILWRHVATLRDQRQPVDPILLQRSLREHGDLERVGGEDEVLKLTDSVPNLSSLDAHADLVRHLAQVRRMITASTEVAAEGYSVAEDPQGYLDRAESRILEAARERHAESGVEHVREAVVQRFEEIRAAANRGEKLTGVPTGLRDMDKLTLGLSPAELWIGAARPGMGKSSLAIEVACSVAEAGQTAMIASLEMGRNALVDRMIARRSGVNSRSLQAANIRHDEWSRVTEATEHVHKLPLYIDDTPALTLLQLRARARRIRSQSGLGVVIVDYLQLMRAGGRHNNREQEVAEISRGLKALAKELDVPVLAFAQLNRESEARKGGDKRPRVSELRESGAIEQDADVILMLYRDEMYNEASEDPGIAELIIGKQREGPTGKVRARYWPEYSRFDDLANAYED